MKLIDILKEIGDSSAKPYPLHRMGRVLGTDTIAYEFDAEAGEYQVDILKMDLDDGTLKYEVGFGLKDERRPTGVNYTQETNKGDLFTVMATVVDAVKKEMAYDEENEYPVTKLAFSPTKAEIKDPSGLTVTDLEDRRREKLYLAYVKQNFPNAEVKTDKHGHQIDVTLNKPKK